jgi:hypothetical protein
MRCLNLARAPDRSRQDLTADPPDPRGCVPTSTVSSFSIADRTRTRAVHFYMVKNGQEKRPLNRPLTSQRGPIRLDWARSPCFQGVDLPERSLLHHIDQQSGNDPERRGTPTSSSLEGATRRLREILGAPAH